MSQKVDRLVSQINTHEEGDIANALKILSIDYESSADVTKILKRAECTKIALTSLRLEISGRELTDTNPIASQAYMEASKQFLVNALLAAGTDEELYEYLDIASDTVGIFRNDLTRSDSVTTLIENYNLFIAELTKE